MSLIRFFEDPLGFQRPSRLLNQHFGLCLNDDDILSAPSILDRKLRRKLLTSPYLRKWKSRDVSVTNDKEAFKVNVDVQQFEPEEITVKATGDNQITIEGKHEEKEDEHGFISRQFVRKYTLPKGYDINKVVSKLSSDGVLTITTPKIETRNSVREIPIQQTGVPSQIAPKENDGNEDQVNQMEVSEGATEVKQRRRK